MDAFRGLTILGMLLVNNISMEAPPPRHLTHAGWNEGVYFADLVFPWFLLIVGVAIPYSLAASRKKGVSALGYCLKAVGRAATLVLLGCLINSSLVRQPIFSLGVLQLIGLAYFVGAVLYQLPMGFRIGVAVALLLSHWGAIRFYPVPEIGAGAFTEQTNLIAYINSHYLSPWHLQGLISVVPTSALVLIGCTVGDVLRWKTASELKKTLTLVIGGFVLSLLAFAWSKDLPYNKPLWTAPYILHSAGLGAMVLGAFYLVIDVAGWRWWAFPLVVCGVNAITAYVLPILAKAYILQVWTWHMPDGSHPVVLKAFYQYLIDRYGGIMGGWYYTIIYIVFWWTVMFEMYRRKIFLRV